MWIVGGHYHQQGVCHCWAGNLDRSTSKADASLQKWLGKAWFGRMANVWYVETGESLCAKECASGIDFLNIYTQFLPICGHPISPNMRRAQSKKMRGKRSKYLGVIANQGLPRNTWKETQVEQLKMFFHVFPHQVMAEFHQTTQLYGLWATHGELANALGLYHMSAL